MVADLARSGKSILMLGARPAGLGAVRRLPPALQLAALRPLLAPQPCITNGLGGGGGELCRAHLPAALPPCRPPRRGQDNGNP